MAVGPLVLCALLRLGEGPVTTYEIGALSEARGQLQEQRGNWARLGELEVDPKLSLNVDSLTYGLAVAYGPRLWLTSQYSGLQVLHRAAVQAFVKPDPLYKLSAGVVGATGMSNLLAPQLASLAGTPAAPLQVVGVQTQVRYVFGEASAGIDVTPTARTRLALIGAWQADGGGDKAAQVSLPLQKGPRATLVFDWRLSADDRLDGELLASRRTFTTSGINLVTGAPLVMPPVWVATLTELWRRRFDQEFSIWAGGGVAVSGTEAMAGVERSVDEAPVIDAGLQYVQEGGQRRLRLSARYAPIIDAVTGRIYQRADSVLMVTWAPARIWRLVGDFSGGVALVGVDRGQKVVNADVRLAYGLSRELEATCGVRGYWQEPPVNSLATSYRQWGLFVGLSYLHKDVL